MLLLGMTPGRYQMYQAVRAARSALLAGPSWDEAIRRANDSASFAGPMRRNTVAMLDDIGLVAALAIPSTASLFAEHANLTVTTSAICHATFVDGGNYRGQRLLDIAILHEFVTRILATELELTPDALVIPFGMAATAAIHFCADAGHVDPRRCLLGFPHPSGGNGHRVRQVAQQRDQLHRAVAGWQPT